MWVIFHESCIIQFAAYQSVNIDLARWNSRTSVRICQLYVIFQCTMKTKVCHQVKNNYQTTMFSLKMLNNSILIGLSFRMTNDRSDTPFEDKGDIELMANQRMQTSFIWRSNDVMLTLYLLIVRFDSIRKCPQTHNKRHTCIYLELISHSIFQSV